MKAFSWCPLDWEGTNLGDGSGRPSYAPYQDISTSQGVMSLGFEVAGVYTNISKKHYFKNNLPYLIYGAEISAKINAISQAAFTFQTEVLEMDFRLGLNDSFGELLSNFSEQVDWFNNTAPGFFQQTFSDSYNASGIYPYIQKQVLADRSEYVVALEATGAGQGSDYNLSQTSYTFQDCPIFVYQNQPLLFQAFAITGGSGNLTWNIFYRYRINGLMWESMDEFETSKYNANKLIK